VYIPSTLVVFISWISFWLDCSATTARTQLGILTVFTMTTQRTSAGISLPKVSYVIAIDIWYFLCLSFVFASVIEFAFVNVLTRRSLKNTRTRNTQRDTSEECTLENQVIMFTSFLICLSVQYIDHTIVQILNILQVDLKAYSCSD
jgi:hypothetical protein